MRQFREAADAGDDERAHELARTASRDLDKAVSSGVIHKNQAANRKSSIAKRAASSEPAPRSGVTTGRHPSCAVAPCRHARHAADAQAGDVTRPDGPAPTTASTIRSSAWPPSASAPLIAASASATASIARAHPAGPSRGSGRAAA